MRVEDGDSAQRSSRGVRSSVLPELLAGRILVGGLGLVVAGCGLSGRRERRSAGPAVHNCSRVISR